MNTYLIESNLTSWAVDAEDAFTATCGWIIRGMRDEDEANANQVRVREIEGGEYVYPMCGLDGVDLARFMGESRAEIDAASRTTRRVGESERMWHRANGRLSDAYQRIGALEGMNAAIADVEAVKQHGELPN